MNSAKLLLIAALAYTAYACQPIIRVYETNEDGKKTVDVLIVVDEIDMAKNKKINNSGTFTCVEGVWMGYQWEGYAGASYLVSGGEGGLDNCREENDGRLFRSLKVVGSPVDYTASAAVAYMGANNELMHTTYLPTNNTEDLINPFFNSLIIIGNEEVELFSERGFQGSSFCIRPNNGMIKNASEFEGINDRLNGTELFTDLTNLNLILNSTEFHSLRFGCGEHF